MTIAEIESKAEELATIQAAVKQLKSRVKDLKGDIAEGMGENSLTEHTFQADLAGTLTTLNIAFKAQTTESVSLQALEAIVGAIKAISVATVTKKALKKSDIPKESWQPAVVPKTAPPKVTVKPAKEAATVPT